MTINELVNDALARWAKVVKVNPKKRKQSLSEWDMNRKLEDLNKSRDLDVTGLTTFMMLRGLTEEYLRTITVSAYELILDPKPIAKELAAMRHLRDLLESEEVVGIIRDFQTAIFDRAKKAGMSDGKLKALEKFCEDKLDLAFIRRDALQSMERLSAHQFAQGDPDPKELKLNGYIYEFWNINSVVAAMAAQRISGVTVVVLRDPEQLFNSYFVFAIRNGGTLTILTDHREGPHPGFSRMTRRPDRHLQERAQQNWFPYELLELGLSEDGKSLFAKKRPDTLVPTNLQGVPIRPIHDLDAPYFIWLHLTFDLIRQRYGREHKLLPELSYTGEMVAEPGKLIEQSTALIKVETYKTLDLPVLSNQDVTEEATAEQWENPTTGHNRWMEARYKDQVPEEYFNVIGRKQQRLLDSEASKTFNLEKSFFAKENDLVFGIESLNPVSFGTKTKLDRDRRWSARVNQMSYIQKLAKQEFVAEREKAIAWYNDKIRANDKTILEAVARGEMLLPDHKTFDEEADKSGAFLGGHFCHGFSKIVEANCLRQRFKYNDGFHWYKDGIAKLFTLNQKYTHYCCYINKEMVASVFTEIQPSCPEAIAMLTAIPVEDLPWYFKYWYKDEPYHGNSILDRLDPQDWVLKNPWKELSLRVLIALSKSAYNGLRKKLGLPHKKLEKSI